MKSFFQIVTYIINFNPVKREKCVTVNLNNGYLLCPEQLKTLYKKDGQALDRKIQTGNIL